MINPFPPVAAPALQPLPSWVRFPVAFSLSPWGTRGRLEIPLWSFQGCSRPRVRLHASTEGGDLGSAYCVLYGPGGGGIFLHIFSMPLSCEIRLSSLAYHSPISNPETRLTPPRRLGFSHRRTGGDFYPPIWPTSAPIYHARHLSMMQGSLEPVAGVCSSTMVHLACYSS